MASLAAGLDVYHSLWGVDSVERHVSSVPKYLYEQFAALTCSNGQPVVQKHGKHHLPNRRKVQGGTINIQLLSPDGKVRSYKKAGRRLAEAGLHVRTGCTCNPGACYMQQACLMLKSPILLKGTTTNAMSGSG